MLFIKIEDEQTRRIADRLLNSKDASVREQASVFLNLGPETFFVLASNLVDVSASDLDSEKNETSQIAALSTSTPNLDLDEWLADRLKNLITGNLESADRNQPQPIFDFEDFNTMRLAFTANQFPKMAATLIHVGINFYPHEIVAMTLASIDSLRDPSTSKDTMKKFLQSLLTDAELLASNGGITLLEDLKEILTQRFQLPIESLAFDEVLRHEIEFAVRIACANGITLSPTLEALVTHSDELSSIYLKDGKVSVGFLDQAVSKGQAKTLISLLEIIEQYPKAQNLSASQLETIADRLPEVFDSAVELGRKVNAPTESIGHLYDAARLLELEGCISSALQTLDMPDHSQIFPRT